MAEHEPPVGGRDRDLDRLARRDFAASRGQAPPVELEPLAPLTLVKRNGQWATTTTLFREDERG